MPKKARKPTEKELSKRWDYRPPPTKTPQEIMAWRDAENMVRLLSDLITCMPISAKATMQTRGFLQFKFRGYSILIADTKKYEQNHGNYGKVCHAS